MALPCRSFALVVLGSWFVGVKESFHETQYARNIHNDGTTEYLSKIVLVSMAVIEDEVEKESEQQKGTTKWVSLRGSKKSVRVSKVRG